MFVTPLGNWIELESTPLSQVVLTLEYLLVTNTKVEGYGQHFLHFNFIAWMPSMRGLNWRGKKQGAKTYSMAPEKKG